MKTLQISEANALKAHREGTGDSKKLLEYLFGKEVFNQKITDRVKTFEDALAITGEPSENMKIMLSYNGIEKDLVALKAYAKMFIITRALNEGWVPDWSNHSQNKYYAWFYMNGSGSGFSYSDFDYTDSSTDVGSRLCFKSAELAMYAAKQFEDLYQDMFTL